MSEQAARPAIELSPTRPLVDEELSVRVTGLADGATVTLRARERVRDSVYAGSAEFVADDGSVDLAADAPVEGDYDGVRPMGLVQFATEDPDADPDELGTPVSTAGTDADGSDAFVVPGEIEAVVDGRVVDAAEYERVVRPAAVEKRDVEHPELVGDLYLPAGDGPHPGVLYFGGSEGGRPGEAGPSVLAARGYAVLGLAYFGTDGLPDHLVDVPVEYFEAALAWLADREAVRSAPLGVVSASRGSEMALHLGATRPEISAVVVRAPSDVRYGGIWRGKPDEWDDPGAAWTRDGDPIPYVPVESSPLDLVRWFAGGLLGRPADISHTYVDGREAADEATVDAATFPVEDVGGPILLVSGEDDRLWPSTQMADRMTERLREADYDHRFEHHSYPDAGHAITVPYLPATGRETTSFLPGVEMAMGGTPEGYAEADADSWPRALDVLDDALR